jgi:hypothetical protein
MSWLILFSHSFNPVLLLVGITSRRNGEETERAPTLENTFVTVLSSFFMYLVWLGAHYIVLKIAGSGFDYEDFIGVGKGVAYFLPFMLGFVMLVIELIIRPGLKTETSMALVSSLTSLLIFFSSYFMFVNYLSWIAN